jgi:hypothetical protein
MTRMSVADGANLRAAVDVQSTHNGSADEGHGPAIASLPPPTTKRWVIRRKAAVVAAVRAGVLSLEEACQRYHLSAEEFLSWQRLIDRHGMRGLRATRLQDYRLQRPLQTG